MTQALLRFGTMHAGDVATSERLRKRSQAERLRELLSDGLWHSNWELAQQIYGPRPCGRLGARVWDLQRKGAVIEGKHDEHDRQKYWYRMLEGGA